MSGFVVCPACGTRIKAGRQHCLRCFELLPDPDVPVRPPIWESLGLSQGKLMIVGIVASLLVLTLIVVIWSTGPEPIEEITAPIAVRTAPPADAAPAAAAPAQTTGGPAVDPLTLAEATPPELTATERADLEARRTEFEQAAAKTPDDPGALNNLGQVLARLGQTAEALARFERAVALAPSNAAYHFNLARAATALGNRGRAVESLREAARLLPKDGATHYTLGVALQKNNDNEAALPELERAVALSPSDPKPHLAYAVSLEQMQRIPDAIREYTRFVEMRPTAPEAEGIKTHIQTLQTGRP